MYRLNKPILERFNKNNVYLQFFHFAVSGNEESQLIADKFKNYNKNIRPARNPEEKVKVQVKLTLTNLISLVTNLPANIPML